jgi:hypothetical protein
MIHVDVSMYNEEGKINYFYYQILIENVFMIILKEIIVMKKRSQWNHLF